MVRVLGKKGQFLDIAIVIVIVMVIVSMITGSLSQNDKLIKIGDKELVMFSAYAEGEKVTEYLKTAGELAVLDSVGDCTNADTLSEDVIAYSIRNRMDQYIANYTSTNPKFNVTFPDYYTYTVSNQIQTGSLIELTGIASNDIVVKSSDYKLTYGLNGDFRSTIRCENLYTLSKGASTTASLIG